ncbi:hypothetical protein AW736_11135 [Termitidicoccus mucosus]|uniref:Uncharacterized protein n=2 Tax=Termitidicoccus mucosus TaxID=1184151 RepID=A0A178IL61_9BACT|nr:hypothetical protein AW736_11135 [Opitutaceae bacterium TSB47]
MEIKDIAASVSTSLAQSLQTSISNVFGPSIRQLGSGTLSARLDEAVDTGAKNAADATATSSTAKSGDGGLATSTATTSAQGSNMSDTVAGIPKWALVAIAGAAAAGFAVAIIRGK